MVVLTESSGGNYFRAASAAVEERRQRASKKKVMKGEKKVKNRTGKAENVIKGIKAKKGSDAAFALSIFLLFFILPLSHLSLIPVTNSQPPIFAVIVSFHC